MLFHPLNTTFPFLCFPIGLPSLTTSYLVFSLLSLFQPLRMLFQRYISLFSPVVHIVTPCLDQRLGDGQCLAGARWKALNFYPRLLLHDWKVHVTTLTSDILLTGTVRGECSARAFPWDKDCCLPSFSSYLPQSLPSLVTQTFPASLNSSILWTVLHNPFDALLCLSYCGGSIDVSDGRLAKKKKKKKE